MRRLLLVLALTTASIVVVAAFWTDRRDDSLDRLRQAGTLRIGYAVEAPFAFVTAQGTVTGEAPETARVIVSRLNLGRVTWRQVEFDLLIGELLAGRIDVIAAGTFVTPERARQVQFSRPTVQVAQGLLVPAGNPERLHAYSDLASRPELRVAVLSGSFEETTLLDLGLPPQNLVPVPDAATGRSAVASGEAHALALSAPTLRWMLSRHHDGRVELAHPFAQPPPSSTTPSGQVAFAFRPGDEALARAWDRELAAWVGSDDHRALLARFGFTGADLPRADAP